MKSLDQYCDYHPADTARWHCTSCHRHYCSGCMPDAQPKRQLGYCPACGEAMQFSGAAGEIEPFWNRMPHFFAYPLRQDPVLLILLCTLVPLFLGANLVSAAVSLFLFLALFKYLYHIIEHTAQGHLEPPPLSHAFGGTGYGVIFQQLAVLFLMGALVVLAGHLLGGLPAFLVLMFMILALPASIILLAQERTIGGAFNPLALMALISRLGWPYAVLYAHLILLMIAGAVLQDFALTNFPYWISQPLAGLISSYFLIIFFHMLGYVLLQYQGELGFAAEIQDGDNGPDSQPADRSRRLEADIDIQLKEGNYDQVLALLEQAIKRQPRDDHQVARLYRLIRARDDRRAMRKHYKRILPWLIREQDGENLGHLLRVLVTEDRDWRLDDPDLAFQCAQVLYHQGDHKLVLWLLKGFHQKHPDHERVPDALLQIARSLANGLQQFDKAAAYLRFIARQYPDHPLNQLIPRYLEQAENKRPIEA